MESGGDFKQRAKRVNKLRLREKNKTKNLQFKVEPRMC